MAKTKVLTAFRPEPIEMEEDEAEALRVQGLLREPPATPAAETVKPAAKQEPAAK
jgi:hypothetical protein